ncbi:SIS domain-containing protein [Curtobacterium sp. VKM Ac-1376]|uniref:SIS domain-containing protein n=1 Tax=Curtobacterium sp. VKM Ac-1376 TaxID=123312 RepID=UPI00188C2A2E|nr:hypothetical protein [Curtobacterium sp. VKM Ac-1376]MBF4616008.1 hypothetical protein [Curtobacterium sp. VKM Ac-1376]
MIELQPFSRTPFADVVRAEPTILAEVVQTFPETLRAAPLDDLVRARDVLFAGIGASHAALAAAVHVLRTAGVRVHRSTCADLPAGSALADAVLVVSQSGRSTETLAALRAAPAGHRWALTNASVSPVGNAADVALSLGGQPDSLVSSAGYTGTVAALGQLVDRWTTGSVAGSWGALPEVIVEAVDRSRAVVEAFADHVASVAAVDVVASSALVGAAENAALLLREGLGIPATGTETRMYLHGPLVPGRNVARVLIGDDREGRLVGELPDPDTSVLLFTGPALAARTPFHVVLPDLPPAQRSIVATVVLQHLVLAVGERIGRGVPTTLDEFPTTDDTKVGINVELGR